MRKNPLTNIGFAFPSSFFDDQQQYRYRRTPDDGSKSQRIGRGGTKADIEKEMTNCINRE